jgi:hypothetical protein
LMKYLKQIVNIANLSRPVCKKYSHAVSVLDSRQSVSNCDGRSALGSFIKRLLDNLLRVGVKRRRSLVEQKHPRISQQGTSNGNTFYKRYDVNTLSSNLFCCYEHLRF